jgi:hypothetical protein
LDELSDEDGEYSEAEDDSFEVEDVEDYEEVLV